MSGQARRRHLRPIASLIFSLSLAAVEVAAAATEPPQSEVKATGAGPETQLHLSNGPQGVLEIFDGNRLVPIGVIDRTTHEWHPGESPELHGANGHCAPGSNDTAAVQAFLDAVQGGGNGSWSGCYNVDEGKLILTPAVHAPLVSTGGFKTFAAPHISGNATFVARGTGSGPMLSIINPPQTSGNGTFYAGGSIENLTFLDRTHSTITSRHGLFMQGLYDWSFGQIMGQDLAGSAVYNSKNTFNGNPDPYGSGRNLFRAIECSRCTRPAFDAEDYGEGGEHIGFIAAYGIGPSFNVPMNGAMIDAGQDTMVDGVSDEFTRGWGIIYGNPRFHGNRQTLRTIELDATENGIWAGALVEAELSGRIIYDPVPGSNLIWPVTAIKLGGMGSQVRDVTMHFIIRIDPGTTLRNLVEDGALIDLSNDPNLRDDEIDLTVQDNAKLGIFTEDRMDSEVSQLIKNINRLAQIRVKINGHVIYDTLKQPAR
jgi:hypothetical protein